MGLGFLLLAEIDDVDRRFSMAFELLDNDGDRSRRDRAEGSSGSAAAQLGEQLVKPNLQRKTSSRVTYCFLKGV